MWVRTQCKTALVNVNEVYIEQDLGKGECMVYGSSTSCSSGQEIVLGKYKKLSTAMKCLEEIQYSIVDAYMRKRQKTTRCLAHAGDVLYEMPEDEEE